MTIKANTIIIGGKKFTPAVEVVKAEPKKPPQDQVEIFNEPKLVSTRNSFILQSNSKFHRDMKE
jgi:hypothetical protein